MRTKPIIAEEWRAVAGTQGRYEVSNRGRVRSYMRQAAVVKKPVILKGYKTQYGYSVINVCYPPPNNRRKQRFVHALVLEAFVGNKPTGMECRHLNGRKLDNRLENLRWGTDQENAQDSLVHGTFPIGSRNGSSKLVAKDIREIRRLWDSGVFMKDIAIQFGISEYTAWLIAKRLTWTHVKSNRPARCRAIHAAKGANRD